jgi:O-antigen/teichoic acid export membrane protein
MSRGVASMVLLASGVSSDAAWSLVVLLPVLCAGLALSFMPTSWLVVQSVDSVPMRTLASLTWSALGQQVTMNAGPILVTVGTGGASVAAAGLYLNTLSIARAPQLPIYGVQGAWAPRLAASLPQDPAAGWRSLRSHLKAALALLGLLSLGCLALSPLLMLLLTGSTEVSVVLMLVLLTTTILISSAQSVTLAANASGMEGWAARAWLVAGCSLVLLGAAAGGVAGVAAANLAVAVGLVVALIIRVRGRLVAGSGE